MSLAMYRKDACVLIRSGQGWPDANSRPGVSPPVDFGEMSIGYLVRRGNPRSTVFVIGKRSNYLVNNTDIEPFDPNSSGPRTDPKICLSCHRLKPLSEYPRNQNNRAGPITRPRCQQCYAAESGPSLSERAKREFRQAVSAPDKGDCWQCPICEKVSIADVTASIVVDHDQERRRPRGILCDSCNTGLGRFKNGEDHLQRAIDYLRNYEANQAEA